MTNNKDRVLLWKRPFRRPRKIKEGDCIEGNFAISEEEYLLLKEYSGGKSVDDLAWGFETHKSTICRSLRTIISKIIRQTKQAKENEYKTIATPPFSQQ